MLKKEIRLKKENLKQKKIQILLIFLSLFYTHCSPKQLAPNTLFVILDSKPNTLDPRKATDANGMRLSALLFSGLVKLGDKGELEPDLALSWKLKGLNYTFYLKPELRFSNGRLVNKEDILFSFKEFQKRSSPFHSAFKNIESVEVSIKEIIQSSNTNTQSKDIISNVALNLTTKTDKSSNLTTKTSSSLTYTNNQKTESLSNQNRNQNKKQFIVKISLKEFQAPFLYSDLTVIKILPKKEILESPKEFQKKPFGTGEFKIEKNDFREILLKRNSLTQSSLPQYISFHIIRDSITRTQKMLSKEADIAPSVIPLQKISQFERQKEYFSIQSRPGLSTTYLLINLKNKLLQNKQLRKALALSLNPQEIIKYKFKGYALPARSFINPENYFFNKNLKQADFNLTKAKNIIKNLGLTGTRFQLSASNNKDTVGKAQILMSQMNQTGLKVSLQTNEWGAFYKDIGQGAYDLALMKWVGVTDPDIYKIAFHSENLAPKGRNRSFYINKNLDTLLSEGLKTRNKTKRKQIYDQIQEIISEEFVVIPLWHDMEISILKNNVENYTIRQNGDFLSLPLVYKK